MYSIYRQLTGGTEEHIEARQWATDMQAQCFELISQLYAEDNPEHLPLIGFIAGVGECCSEIETARQWEQHQ